MSLLNSLKNLFSTTISINLERWFKGEEFLEDQIFNLGEENKVGIRKMVIEETIKEYGGICIDCDDGSQFEGIPLEVSDESVRFQEDTDGYGKTYKKKLRKITLLYYVPVVDEKTVKLNLDIIKNAMKNNENLSSIEYIDENGKYKEFYEITPTGLTENNEFLSFKNVGKKPKEYKACVKWLMGIEPYEE